ncbi:MAG: hypothetical protein ACFCVA_09950 [Gammaproteobacteria bacterium]
MRIPFFKREDFIRLYRLAIESGIETDYAERVLWERGLGAGRSGRRLPALPAALRHHRRPFAQPRDGGSLPLHGGELARTRIPLASRSFAPSPPLLASTAGPAVPSAAAGAVTRGG